MSVSKPTSPQVDPDLAAATAPKLNLSRTRDETPNQERGEKIRRWQAEHADVVDWYNHHIERDGIFGEEWRAF
jgi:post-segregation antitoxin (ccd killing protein)